MPSSSVEEEQVGRAGGSDRRRVWSERPGRWGERGRGGETHLRAGGAAAVTTTAVPAGGTLYWTLVSATRSPPFSCSYFSNPFHVIQASTSYWSSDPTESPLSLRRWHNAKWQVGDAGGKPGQSTSISHCRWRHRRQPGEEAETDCVRSSETLEVGVGVGVGGGLGEGGSC